MKTVKITIPDYPDKIMISKSRRAIYYVSKTSHKAGRKTIPPRYKSDKYTFNEDGILIRVDTGNYQLANPRSVGKPRYWVVNFQDIWNQNITKQTRSGYTGKLKDILRPYISKIKPIKAYPVAIEIKLYDVSFPVDVSNKGVIYTKIIEDLLVTEGKMPDDNIKYVTCSGKTTCIIVDDIKKKKMEVLITKIP